MTAEPPQGATERFDDDDEDEDERKWRAPTKNHILLAHPHHNIEPPPTGLAGQVSGLCAVRFLRF